MPEIFKAQKLGMELGGGGVNFWSSDFLGVVLEALRIFVGFYFCPHLTIPTTRNPEFSPLPGLQYMNLYKLLSLRNLQCS